MPNNYSTRLVEFEFGDLAGTIGLCLEPHDLAFSKLAAGREKDIDFIRGLLKYRLINQGKLKKLIENEAHEDLKATLLRSWTITLRERP